MAATCCGAWLCTVGLRVAGLFPFWHVLLRFVLQVRELATQIRKLQKEGFKKPFVFADLRK